MDRLGKAATIIWAILLVGGGLFVALLILGISFMGDGKKPKELEYILISRHGSMDTISRELLYNNHNDTFNIISYKTTWGEDVGEQEFKFPVKTEFDSLTEFTLLDSAVIKFEGKEYKIFKYLFDDKQAADEEALYFYSTDFGVLSFRSAWWGNYDRLTKTGDEQKDRIIFYLTEMIMNDDKEFFIRWN